MKKRIVIIIGCLILCMSMGGCSYLAAERNGAMFPSTREFWRGSEYGRRYGYVYPFLPTVRGGAGSSTSLDVSGTIAW